MLETRSRLQAVPEIASELQESNRVIDAYSFVQDRDGDLYSPTAKRKIKDSVFRGNDVGELEGQTVDRINDWFKFNNEGAVAWVSPPDLKYYPTSKIIISEIIRDQGKKRLLNRVILLDHNSEQSIELAQVLAERSKNQPFLDNVDSVRSTPIFLEKDSWLDVMSEAIDAPEVWRKIRSGEDLIDQNKALSQAGQIFDRKSRFESFSGGGGGSCPESMGSKTGFGVFSGAAVVLEACSKIACKECPWEADQNEVRDIQAGKLTCCPDCGWKP